MKTTAYYLDALVREGLTHAFLVPGGLIDPFLEDLAATPGLTPVVAAHEGGAVCMADGYARASGRFGACLCIGGPGVTNTLTGVVAASTDNSPVLVISGQVPTNWEGRGGFQDSSPATLNDLAMLDPAVRKSLAVENTHLAGHHLRSALTAMLAGAQGPVHLSLPTDIQRGDVATPWTPLDASLYRPRVIDPEALERALDILAPPAPDKAPERVAILAGAGVEKSGCADELVRFAEAYAIPVATTLRAKGVFPEDHPLSLGVFGYAGHRHAIEGLTSGEVEALVVLGSGLSQRDTLFWDRNMLPTRALIHADIDPTVIGRTWPSEAPLTGDCGEILRYLLRIDGDRAVALADAVPGRRRWLEKIRALGPRLYDPQAAASDDVPLHPARVATALRAAMPRHGAVVVDSGAHRAFCGHYWQAYAPRTYFSATNIGPMGWAIPAACGIKAARPDLPLAVVTGDGCMLMHGMEIHTAARYGLAVVFVVINNQALGNVWLRSSRQGPGPAGLTEIPGRDFAAMARSLGLEAATVQTPDELVPAFEKALASGRPYLVDVRCDKRFTTPVAPFGQAKALWVDE